MVYNVYIKVNWHHFNKKGVLRVKKEDLSVSGALLLIAATVSVIHVTVDEALTKAINTGNALLLSQVENLQRLAMSFETVGIVGVLLYIASDVRQHARRIAK